MANAQPYRVRSIAECHDAIGLPKPAHPLISVVSIEQLLAQGRSIPGTLVFDFYSISLKLNCVAGYKYGQQQYTLGAGTMFFMAPGQVFGRGTAPAGAHAGHQPSGWVMYIHPDFLWNTPLAKAIKQYEYFSYAVNEALHLSEKEESIIIALMQSIQQEYEGNMDKFTQDIIISQITTLLNYCERFYQRQFLTHKMENHAILARVEAFIDTCLAEKQGLPGVQQIAASLHISPNYLSSLLKVLTGRNAQQHIQDKIIEKAKERISTSELSVAEIAYELGFEHPQSFSRLFKARTGLTPLAFRQSFN